MTIQRGFNNIISNPNGRLNKFLDNKRTQKTIEQLSDYKALLPVVLLEGSVCVGRCYQAQKRGGKVERNERLREEVTTAAVWLGGVATFNKIGDFIIKKAFGIDIDVAIDKNKFGKKFDDLAKDLKSPLSMVSDGRINSNYSKKIIGLKSAKIIASAALAVYTVGSIIPKINQAFTRKTLANLKKDQEKNQKTQAKLSDKGNSGKVSNKYGSLIKNTKNTGNVNAQSAVQCNSVGNSNSNVKFKGGFDVLSVVANNLENNNVCRLLTVDTGVLGGRMYHARNKDERVEIAFKDGASIPFYMFTTPLVVMGLSHAFDEKLGINTKLNPKVVMHVNDKIIMETRALSEENNGKVDFQELYKRVFGTPDGELTPNLKRFSQKNEDHLFLKDSDFEKNFKNILTSLNSKNPSKNKMIIKNAEKQAHLNAQGVICGHTFAVSNYLEDFSKLKTNEGNKELHTLAKDFKDYSALMYQNTALGKVFDHDDGMLKKLSDSLKKMDVPNKDIHKEIDKSHDYRTKLKIVTAEIEDIVTGGLLNDSEFLGEAYTIAKPDKKDYKRTVSQREISEVKENIKTYAERMLDKMNESIESKKLTEMSKDDVEKFLTKTKNMNSLARIGYVSAGLLFSGYFLSYAIPKMQYYITKLRTGKNEFPGIQGADDEINDKDTKKVTA